MRDLGVNMSPDYTWSTHVARVTEEGKKTLSWVLSVFRDRSKLTMLTLYNSLVRSKLEYCCPSWNPSAVADIQKLESVQRVFTSKVAGCRELAYWERLKLLKIQSLQRRRERYAIIHTWKILNNLTNNDIGLSFTDTENSSRTGIRPRFLLFLGMSQPELSHCTHTHLLLRALCFGIVFQNM